MKFWKKQQWENESSRSRDGKGPSLRAPQRHPFSPCQGRVTMQSTHHLGHFSSDAQDHLILGTV